MRIDKNTTIRLGDRNIVKIKIGDSVIWEKKTEPDYFYIESLGNRNTISVINKGDGSTSGVTPTLEYSKDKSTWNTITFDWTSGEHTTELPVKLNTGEKMYFRNDTHLFSNNYTKYILFSPSVSSNVGGDIRTLSNYLNVDSETKTQIYMFYYLFYNNKNIVDASNLRLPYTTLESFCYRAMFNGCTSLTTAPELPATTLASFCYRAMFNGCTSLTTAPALPAVNLASGCYSNMFQGCTSLTSAPVLPATTLEQSCYDNMFNGCKALTTAPVLPAVDIFDGCYYSMFKGCTSLTSAPALPATTLKQSCYSNMFNGCTSLTSAPALPATTLASNCYYNMFQGCTSLNKILVYANSGTTSGNINDWLNGVAASGTFYNFGGETYTQDSTSGIPTGWSEVTTVSTTSVYVEPNTFSVKSWESTPKLNYTIIAENETGIDVQSNKTVSLQIGENTGSSNRTITQTYSFDGIDYTLTINQTANDIDEPDYFYIESLDDENTVTLNTYLYTDYSSYMTPTLQFSTDKRSWSTVTFDWSKSGTHTTELPVKLNTGGKMYFRNDTGKFNFGKNDDSFGTSWHSKISFSTNKNTNVGGDIRTLLNYIDVETSSMRYTCTFGHLFENNKYIVDASNLRLSYSSLESACYYSMFKGCTSLTSAPALPAVNLASGCYYSMFQGCTSLTSAPALPVTTLKQSCYSNMFNGCKALTTAPVLPATTLEQSCYSSMFQGCTSLTTAPVLPATTLEQSCYSSMFQGCTSLTSAPTLPATTLVSSCYDNMFNGCKALTTAPTLPATTLVPYCYDNMFNGCKALTTAPVLPAVDIFDGCYSGMFKGCTSLTSVTIYAKNASYYSHGSWLYNVAPSGTVYNNGFLDLPKNNGSGVPTGWTEVVPEIQSITVNPDTFTIEFNSETVTCNSTLEVVTTIGTLTKTNSDTLTVGENTGSTTRTITKTIPYYNTSYDVTIVQSAIESITANPDTFNIKSYKDTVKCNSTLTITTTLGTTVTDTNSATITVGENTGDTTRTIVETIPYRGSSYQVTIVQTANDVRPPMSWNVVSTGTYPFELNTNNYYESTNKGQNSSYSYATLNYEGFDELVLECINSGESNYDYGIISQPDVQLSESTSDDGATGSTKVFKNFKGQSSTKPVQLTIPSDGGSHFITIKFKKDGSGNNGNDSLQFKVIEP